MNADNGYGKHVLMRDHSKVEEPKDKAKQPITSLDDIIEHKPSVKKVREYFKAVLENIVAEEDSQFKQ